MKKSFCLSLFFFFVAMSCSAQTFTSPSPKIPAYQDLIAKSDVSGFMLRDISLESRTTEGENANSTILTPKTKEALLKVSSISPTHYADTHSAFFCRLERKINKKFVMPVRIRLEGF